MPRKPSTAAIVEIREALGKTEPPADDVEEMTELEVQQMLEARDEKPPPPPVQERVAIEPLTGPHALDLAPVNSKVVVTDHQAILATPGGVHRLPKTDPANALPDGAKILKTAEGIFVATQLSPSVDHPDMTYATAGAAIKDFLRHFHDVKGS